MNIGTKILEYRRRKGATQEELAVYTNVSIAAVSKWETGASSPDIALLPRIAKFLEVSIDALMEFDAFSDDVEKLRTWNNPYIHNNDYIAGIPIYEQAVLRYPNDGNLCRNFGELLSIKASVDGDHETGLRAVKYLEKACKLGCQQEEQDLKQLISFTYGCIGEYEKALAYLDISKSSIQAADYKMKLGKFTEAKCLLQSKLIEFAFDFALLADRLGKCFEQEGDSETGLLLKNFCARFREEFTMTGVPNYFTHLSACDYMELALCYRERGDTMKMVNAIERAVNYAVAFDRNPSYKMEDVRYMKGNIGHFANSSSALVCEGILNHLTSDFADFSEEEWYITCREHLNEAKRSKKDVGLWE